MSSSSTSRLPSYPLARLAIVLEAISHPPAPYCPVPFFRPHSRLPQLALRTRRRASVVAAAAAGNLRRAGIRPLHSDVPLRLLLHHPHLCVGVAPESGSASGGPSPRYRGRSRIADALVRPRGPGGGAPRRACRRSQLEQSII